jgi:hypothetical protein
MLSEDDPSWCAALSFVLLLLAHCCELALWVTGVTLSSHAAVKQHVMEKLGIPNDSSPQEISAIMKSSAHMRDSFITRDYIRYMREQIMNLGWTNDKNDAVSVRMAVRYFLLLNFWSISKLSPTCLSARFKACSSSLTKPSLKTS